jgi:hypothetical protein
MRGRIHKGKRVYSKEEWHPKYLFVPRKVARFQDFVPQPQDAQLGWAHQRPPWQWIWLEWVERIGDPVCTRKVGTTKYRWRYRVPQYGCSSASSASSAPSAKQAIPGRGHPYVQAGQQFNPNHLNSPPLPTSQPPSKMEDDSV